MPPTISVVPGTDPPDQPAGDRCEQHHHQSGRGHPETRLEDRLAEPVAGGRRHLEELGDHDRLGHHPEADRHRRDVGEQDLRAGRWCGGRRAGRPAGARRRPRPAARRGRRRSRPRCDRRTTPSRCPWRRRPGRSPGRRPARACRPRRAARVGRRGCAAPATTVASSTSRPSAAETQNSRCHGWPSAIQAASGSPIAPPTPRVALIAAIAVEVMWGGVNSRSREMPTGMKPIAKPCRVRPSQHRHDRARQGTDHGAGDEQGCVDDQHPLLAVEVGEPPGHRHRDRGGEQGRGDHPARVGRRGRQRCGSSLWIGITMVWVSAAVRPPKQSATTATVGWAGTARADVTGVSCGGGRGRTARLSPIVAGGNQIGSVLSPAGGDPRCPRSCTASMCAHERSEGVR